MPKKLLTIIFVVMSFSLAAQEGRAFYLGLQPSFRTLDDYQQGEFDLNIIPLVAQLTLTRDIDIRFTSIMDYHLPRNGEGISNRGAEVALPIAINEKMARDVESEGLFVAPVYKYFQNKPTGIHYHTFAIEPGYMQVYGHHFGISFGLQLGAQYHKTLQQENQWNSHVGLKLVLGYWFRKDVVLGI